MLQFTKLIIFQKQRLLLRILTLQFFFQTKIIIQIMWPKQSIGGLGLAPKYDKKLLYHIGNILAQVIYMKLCCFANTSSH